LNYSESGAVEPGTTCPTHYFLLHSLQLGTPIFAFKFIFFLMKTFPPFIIYKCKHTFSPRTNENV